MGDLGFAFNDMQISDGVALRIEEIKEDCVGCKRKSTTTDDDSSNNVVLNVTVLNLSCGVLVAQSPFFHKLIENNSKEVTLKINSSEKRLLLDVLNFLYIGNLSATTDPELLAVQTVAEKYEFLSCVGYCSQLLTNPRNLLKLDPPLKEAARNYLAQRYKDLTKSKEDAMALPLCALEVVLSSDGLVVESEDEVYDFIMEWGRKHYPTKLEERRKVLSKRLVRLIYFPYMCSLKLAHQVWDCLDFDGSQASLCLKFNAGFPYGQRMLVADYPHEATSPLRLIKRVYKFHPVKVDYFELPPARCAVHFYLTREECHGLFRSGADLYSRECSLLSHKDLCFYLFVRCRKDQHTSSDRFGLYLCKPVGGKETCTVDYEFQVMKDPSEGFQSEHKAEDCTLTDGDYVGKENMFGVSWTDLVADDSEYFIDDILHLLVDITLKHYQSLS